VVAEPLERVDFTAGDSDDPPDDWTLDPPGELSETVEAFSDIGDTLSGLLVLMTAADALNPSVDVELRNISLSVLPLTLSVFPLGGVGGLDVGDRVTV